MLNKIKFTDQQLNLLRELFDHLYAGIMVFGHKDVAHEKEYNLFISNKANVLLLAAQMYFVPRGKVDSISALIEKGRSDSKVKPFKNNDTYMEVRILSRKIIVEHTQLSWKKDSKSKKKRFNNIDAFVKWLRKFIKKAKKKKYVPLGHSI